MRVGDQPRGRAIPLRSPRSHRGGGRRKGVGRRGTKEESFIGLSAAVGFLGAWPGCAMFVLVAVFCRGPCRGRRAFGLCRGSACLWLFPALWLFPSAVTGCRASLREERESPRWERGAFGGGGRAQWAGACSVGLGFPACGFSRCFGLSRSSDTPPKVARPPPPLLLVKIRGKKLSRAHTRALGM